MPNRCILLFPDFPNINVIEEIRAKYDPAAKLVGPHITMVFPFESDLEEGAVREHIHSVLTGIEPFRVSLQGISAQRGFGNYLLLNVHKGKNTIKEMHRRLYSGVLDQYRPVWCRTFEPHMTVGRVEDTTLFSSAIEDTRSVADCFESCVGRVYVEIIGADGSSTIETVLDLPV